MESPGPECLIGGRYRLGRVIGRGGMGVVWQGRDELLGREVALKELAWPGYLSPAEQVVACRRATREAVVAARLSHRNVIRVFDIIEEDGCPWIVMELVPPWSLGDALAAEGPLTPVRAAEVGLEILAALRAAHAAGIVHRDVKPANILLAPDRVVLTDFGIARAVGSSTLTNAGMLMGSAAYMAPEYAGGKGFGPPADLWGLGATLYAAVEGRGPFDREAGPLASLTAVMADEPETAAHAGPLLWPVISGLLRKDPGERLDARQAERMLRRVIAAPPSPAGAGAVAGMARPRARRRHGRAVALTGVAALALVAASSAVAGFALLGSPQPPAASPVVTPSAPASAPTTATRASRSTAGAHARAPAATHLTSRTSGRAAAHRPPTPPAPPPDRPGHVIPPGQQKPHPHGKPAKAPGKPPKQ